jgi:glycosyltransferase involved in cell wall biosynthesis
MWAAQALRHDFAVSIVAGGDVDLASLNRFYGSDLAKDDVCVRAVMLPARLSELRGANAIRGAFFLRRVRAISHEYDVLISAYNLCDLGVPAIHCMADFSWDDGLRSRLHPSPNGLQGWFHRVQWCRRLYLRFCAAIAPASARNLFSGEDLIIANSRWTATKLRARYGTEAIVIYPPVAGHFPYVPDECRGNDFVCVGRISPEKRIERMVGIVRAVRSRGHSARIRIIGPLDNSPYSRTIASLASRHPEWVLLEGRCMGDEKTRIMGECRYGIHACEGEAFGIGVAEMVKAGCLTFAPAEGGQSEIIDHEALLYRGDKDAVEKISAVLSSRALQLELSGHLRRQAQRFSTEKFMDGIRVVVDEFLRRVSLSQAESSYVPRSQGLC